MDPESKKALIAQLENPEMFEPIAKDSFKLADKDGNGMIDKKELETCMKEVANGLGVSAPTKKMIDEEFKKLDTDKSGTIDFEEFKSFVKKSMTQIIESL